MYTKQIRSELIKGWSNYPSIQAKVFRPEKIRDLASIMTGSTTTILARGGGTSFGDSSINDTGINIDTRRLNKFLNFNEEIGLLHCQSGVTLLDVASVFIPRGWFLHVTPGTQFATVGGCVATDAHGKNWKAGSFCHFVKGFHLMLHDGNIIYCDDKNNRDIFFSTVGGMGMTGIVVDVFVYLKRIYSSQIDTETIRCRNLEECFALQHESMDGYEYMFYWLDTHKEGVGMGRGVLQRANHSLTGTLTCNRKRRFNVPFYLPNVTVNKYSVEVFNNVYYAISRNKSRKCADILEFFYPLDSISNWYRVYGKRGYLEYQIVVPFDGAYQAIFEILTLVSKSKLASNVAAVKPLMNAKGMLSFPMDGMTLAVDFKIDQRLWKLLDQLDEIVVSNGGRVYLAKDARLSSKNFKLMYSKSLEGWEAIIKSYKCEGKFSSMMFSRFFLDA